jgi:hypothetical protein
VFSTDTPAPRRGVGLMGRISSFFVGAGVTALATQFLIYEELLSGNRSILAKQKEIEDRLKKLEK